MDGDARAIPGEAGGFAGNSGITAGVTPAWDGTAPPADASGIKWDIPATPVTPIAADVEADLARLAALDPITYDQCRVDAAAKLSIRVSTLDKQVQARRPMPAAATGHGVSLPQPDPWPAPVTGAELLDGLAAAIRRHVILRPAAADAVALWIAHTWVFERFQHTPRLSITSPAKRCGKSTLLDVLNATCRKPLKADNISASGTFRTVEALSPLTLLLDEADGYLGENEELRSILNSGFERSGNVIRVVEINGEWQPVQFKTFAPVALAAIGKLPDTLEDRGLPLALQRKGAAETVDKLRAPGARAALADLARKAARWSQDRGTALPLDPSIPDALGDREGDIAVPLLSIATDAGAAWAARGRAALLDLFGKREAEGGTAEAGAMLLADLRDLFQAKGATRLPSADIVAALGIMEERPWPEWKQGKPMTAVQLAGVLKPFAVRPKDMKAGDGRVMKAYYVNHLADAWRRYLPANGDAATPAKTSVRSATEASAPAPDTPSPSIPPVRSATPLPHCSHKGDSENQSATEGVVVADRKGENPMANQRGSGVADQKGVAAGERTIAGAQRGAAADRSPPASDMIETVL